MKNEITPNELIKDMMDELSDVHINNILYSSVINDYIKKQVLEIFFSRMIEEMIYIDNKERASYYSECLNILLCKKK